MWPISKIQLASIIIMTKTLAVVKESVILFLCLLGLSVPIYAQDVPIGQWKSYAPYHNAIAITQNADQIFWATDLSIIIQEKSDASVRFIGKENGLSDANISTIKHSPTQDALVIAYTNSNVDLILNGETVNLNFIKTNSNLSGDRSIHNINFFGSIAYLSTAFGIVELDIPQAEFRTTIFTGIEVNDTEVWNDQLLAATEEGIYVVPVDGTKNISDFSQWRRLGTMDGLPDDYQSEALAIFNDQLYVSVNDIIYKYDGSSLIEIYSVPGFSTEYLTPGNTHLIAGYACGSNCNGTVGFISQTDELTGVGNGCVARPLGAIQVGNAIYFAELFSDLRRTVSIDQDCSSFAFNSPNTRNTSDIETDGDNIYIAAGARTIIGGNRNSADGVFFQRDGNWIGYNLFNVPEFSANSADRDFIKIKKHPTENKIYLANYYGGLFEFENDTWTIYNPSNSSLQGVTGFEERIRVGSLDFDSKGNLWMTNHLANRPISVFMADGTWKSFDIPASNAVKDIIVDAFDNKWITIYGSTEGILVFNEGDIDVDTDDKYKLFTSSSSELTTNQVNVVAVDQDGVLWAGTSEGVFTFECGSDPFNTNCRGSQRIVDVGSNRDLLLRTEDTRTIGVDGANRKWFGTTNGIFVQSADGEEAVFRFNTDNSPLYANNIVDFAFDDESGEVFIGTTSGVQSYRSDATKGTALHFKDVKVFPNPVRSDYRGVISISQLAQDANVKITDVQGHLVYETKANGGTALWNGEDFSGRRVATGVYMIFSTVQDNLGKADALVGKVLFIN